MMKNILQFKRKIKFILEKNSFTINDDEKLVKEKKLKI